MSVAPIAIYPGSFDPPTIGHEDLAHRALAFCDRLVVAVGKNSKKNSLFSVEERVSMLRHLFEEHSDRIEVVSFEGLLVQYAKSRGATILVRGLRATMDFEYEMGIAHANAEQVPDIDTVFLATKPNFSFISSSVVREIASYGGPVRNYVSKHVEEKLALKFGRP